MKAWPAAVLAAVMLVGCGGSSRQDPTDTHQSVPDPRPGLPNIVVVMTDDQDVSSLSGMPAVQRLMVRRGLSFKRNYVTTPECCPSRATFLTGQYAHNHGVLTSDPPDGGFQALDGSETLPVWLQRQGYDTSYIGRYLNGYGSSGSALDVPPGWGDWAVTTNGTSFSMYDYELNVNGKLAPYGSEPGAYLTDVLAARASDFVSREQNSDQPFFLVVAPLAPHSEGPLEGEPDVARDPRPAPRDIGAYDDRPIPEVRSGVRQELRTKSATVNKRAEKTLAEIRAGGLRRSYLGRSESLLAVDDLVSGLFDELKNTGLLGRTYVFFTSDNGYLLGEHGLLGKEMPYEPSARVPLVITGPHVAHGSVAGLTANIDLAPTIVELAQAHARLEMDGRSLLPTFEKQTLPPRDLLLELFTGTKSYEAIRTPEGLKLSRFENGDIELYDLNHDPGELVNLAGRRGWSAEQAQLEQQLDALSECAGSACREEHPYPSAP